MQTTTGAKKAAETKRRKRDERIWAAVLAVKELYPDCSCPLKKGMDFDDLRKIVGPLNCKHPLYICSVLDKYRREVGDRPVSTKEDEDED